MQDDLMEASTDYRERVIVFLAFLTSEDCIEAFRSVMPPELLAAELSRLWFDLYVPGDSYLDSLKGDRSEEAIHRFETCFSDDELALLERFHGFFELRINMAVNRMRGRAFFPDNDSWRGLLHHASHVLSELETDAERIQHLLAGFVQQLLGKEKAAQLLNDGLSSRRLGA